MRYFSKGPEPELTLGEVAFCPGCRAPAACRNGELLCQPQSEQLHTAFTRRGDPHGATRPQSPLSSTSPRSSKQKAFPTRTKQKSTWLLNLAYMTLGEYPDKVPELYRLPAKVLKSRIAVPRFPNVAAKLGLDTDSLSGGVVIDDFDGDHDLDIVVSSWDASVPMKYFENRGKDGFHDRSKRSGIQRSPRWAQFDFCRL